MIFDKQSGYKLKYLALFCMLSDHIGVIFDALLPQTVYFVLRAAGRLSFPLFAFLLTEGFFHTKNRKNYAYRLFFFALLSEMPFDLAFGLLSSPAAAFSRQNVFFTLLTGFAAMALLESYPAYTVPVFLLSGLLGELIRADCGAAGIFCILLFYLFREKMPGRASGQKAPGNRLAAKPLPVPAVLLCLLPPVVLLDYPLAIRVCTFAAAVPVLSYNGMQGKGHKYFFYLFYPSHLLLLKLLACFIH